MKSVGIERGVSLGNSTDVFGKWCLDERIRLMEQDHKLFSDFEVLKRIAAVDKNDPANYTYQKSVGHLGRVGFKLQQLEVSRFDPEIAGLCIYSCLKLAVGQQVRRAYTVAVDQTTFEEMMHETPDQSLFIGVDVGTPQDLGTKYEALKKVYIESLDGITDRATVGSDWFLKESESIRLINESEKVSFGMAAAVLSAAVEYHDSFEAVALRPPSSDAENVELVFPFRNK
jgi:hypothetical protein